MAASKRERIDELAALGRLMADPAGRRWVFNLMAEFHVWDTSYATNAMRMAFLEGERNAGLRFQSEVEEANQEMFYLMLKERKNERSTNTTNGANTFTDSIADAPATDTSTNAGPSTER